MPNTNDIKNIFFKILLTANTEHSKDYEIASKHLCNVLILMTKGLI